jgi:hypothetical protein
LIGDESKRRVVIVSIRRCKSAIAIVVFGNGRPRRRAHYKPRMQRRIASLQRHFGFVAVQTVRVQHRVQQHGMAWIGRGRRDLFGRGPARHAAPHGARAHATTTPFVPMRRQVRD